MWALLDMKVFIKQITITLLACTVSFTCLFCHDTVTENETSVHNIYVISNTADLKDQVQILASLKSQFDNESQLFTLLVMGDAFDLGRSLEEQYKQLDNLYQLIQLTGEYINGQMIFMTGDRDWSGRNVVFIGLNSEWWMENTNKPHAADGICNHIYPDEIEEALNELLEENFEKNIILAAHHPILQIEYRIEK